MWKIGCSSLRRKLDIAMRLSTTGAGIARVGGVPLPVGAERGVVDAAPVERGEQRREPCGMFVEDREVGHASFRLATPLLPRNRECQTLADASGLASAIARRGGKTGKSVMAGRTDGMRAPLLQAPRIMLNLTDITVRLGGRTILDGATAKLPPKSRVGLIGRNGAGKTTLVKVIAGMLDPDTGSADMPRGSAARLYRAGSARRARRRRSRRCSPPISSAPR